jgi:hypothetical protein
MNEINSGVKNESEIAPKINILAQRYVDNAQVVIITSSATYRGSAPFSGAFEVWDIDECLNKHAETGKTLLSVRCQWQDEYDEDNTLELEVQYLNIYDLHGIMGYEGDVIDRIGF